MGRRKLYCSFCGKSQAEVLRIMGSPKLSAFICNECIAQCIVNLAADGVEPFVHMGAQVIPFPKRRAESGRR